MPEPRRYPYCSRCGKTAFWEEGWGWRHEDASPHPSLKPEDHEVEWQQWEAEYEKHFSIFRSVDAFGEGPLP